MSYGSDNFEIWSCPWELWEGSIAIDGGPEKNSLVKLTMRDDLLIGSSFGKDNFVMYG